MWLKLNSSEDTVEETALMTCKNKQDDMISTQLSLAMVYCGYSLPVVHMVLCYTFWIVLLAGQPPFRSWLPACIYFLGYMR